MIDKTVLHVFEFNFPKERFTSSHIQNIENFMEGVDFILIENCGNNCSKLLIRVLSKYNDKFLSLTSKFLEENLKELKFKSPEVVSVDIL